jgi:hypothetical protein
MKTRTGTKRPVRRPRRRRITAAEERQVEQMVQKEFPAVYAFSDCLAELKKNYKVDPKRVREILVSPDTVLGPWRELEQQLRVAQAELQHTIIGASRDGCQARIDQLEADLVTAAKAARLGYGQRFGRRKKGPSDRYWYNAPVDMPDEPWMNPHDWPWLRERAAELAAYLSTTRLPNPKRPHRFRTTGHPTKPGPGWYSEPVTVVTAELIRLFYRMGYFPQLEFSEKDVTQALKSYRPRPGVSFRPARI